jgi:hypothetical protein
MRDRAALSTASRGFAITEADKPSAACRSVRVIIADHAFVVPGRALDPAVRAVPVSRLVLAVENS